MMPEESSMRFKDDFERLGGIIFFAWRGVLLATAVSAILTVAVSASAGSAQQPKAMSVSPPKGPMKFATPPIAEGVDRPAQLGFESKRDYFKVPDAALVRPLGDVAKNEGKPFL